LRSTVLRARANKRFGIFSRFKAVSPIRESSGPCRRRIRLHRVRQGIVSGTPINVPRRPMRPAVPSPQLDASRNMTDATSPWVRYLNTHLDNNSDRTRGPRPGPSLINMIKSRSLSVCFTANAASTRRPAWPVKASTLGAFAIEHSKRLRSSIRRAREHGSWQTSRGYLDGRLPRLSRMRSPVISAEPTTITQSMVLSGLATATPRRFSGQFDFGASQCVVPAGCSEVRATHCLCFLRQSMHPFGSNFPMSQLAKGVRSYE
jgi:hypothetical protein